jgi:hypothetical protein
MIKAKKYGISQELQGHYWDLLAISMISHKDKLSKHILWLMMKNNS